MMTVIIIMVMMTLIMTIIHCCFLLAVYPLYTRSHPRRSPIVTWKADAAVVAFAVSVDATVAAAAVCSLYRWVLKACCTRHWLRVGQWS